MTNKSILVILIMLIALFSGCVKRIDRPTKIDQTSYVPLQEGDVFLYSGLFSQMEITDRGDGLFTCTYYDSSGRAATWEDYAVRGGRVLWSRLAFNSPVVPAIDFEPPLPYAPWSNIIGDTLLYSGSEVRSDSINTHLRIRVEYEIIGCDTVTVPAGTYPDCIGVKMVYTTMDDVEIELFGGEFVKWFAPDVGLVKYSTPWGDGELLEARIKKYGYL